jgi:hypothetical protein
MSEMTIKEFCTLHDACSEGRQWALTNCQTMEEAWATACPEWLIWMATRPGVLDDRTLRKFAVWSARQVQHLMTDPRSIAALDVAERHADGLATDDELTVAWASAWAAASAAARAGAWDAQAAAWAAALDVARVAARDAARDSALAAAAATSAAARDAAASAAWATARDAARDAQAAWLRSNATPNFGRTVTSSLT